jgi:hypothetical protein
MSNSGQVRLAVAAAAAVIVLSQAVYSQHHSYQTIENYFKLPEGRKIGSTVGITIDRDGSSIWVFERCGAQNCVGSNLAPILKFDASGKLAKRPNLRTLSYEYTIDDPGAYTGPWGGRWLAG